MVLSERQTDAIAEILNIGVSQAAATLVEIVRDDVTVSLPSIVILPIRQVSAWINATISAESPLCMPSAVLHFHGPISGCLALLFPIRSATMLAEALGVEPTSAGLREVVEESGNILLNAVAGAMANCLGYHLAFDTPYLIDGAMLIGGLELPRNPEERVLLATACFRLAASTIEGQILLHLESAAAVVLAAALDNAAVAR
jgi:chemotaxis protein CheC